MAFRRERCACGKMGEAKILLLTYTVGRKVRLQQSSQSFAACSSCLTSRNDPGGRLRKQLLAAAFTAGHKLDEAGAFAPSKPLLAPASKQRKAVSAAK